MLYNYKRCFEGKLGPFIRQKKEKELTDIEEIEFRYMRNFEQAHLKAYLKGKELFTYGRDKNNQPIQYEVKENWITI